MAREPHKAVKARTWTIDELRTLLGEKPSLSRARSELGRAIIEHGKVSDATGAVLLAQYALVQAVEGMAGRLEYLESRVSEALRDASNERPGPGRRRP